MVLTSFYRVGFRVWELIEVVSLGFMSLRVAEFGV